MKYIFTTLFFLTLTVTQAQELFVSVKVVAPSVQKTDPLIFQNLETAIKEFYNNTRWTNDSYGPEEVINANIQLTITEEVGLNSFGGELIIQSSRPVFNSEYNSRMVNLIDKNVNFSYNNFQPIEKSDNRYVDNLSSVLTFYAYVILGFDYESFSLKGGEDYFRTAQNTMNNLPANLLNGDRGWNQASSDRNRYWLIENLFNPRLDKFRQSIFDYHRIGLDNMADDSDRARATLLVTMNAVNSANTSYPNSYLLNIFVDAKSDELIEIFKVADRSQRNQVYNALVKVDPSNASRYGILK